MRKEPRDYWNLLKKWFDKNFTWKGLLLGIFVLYQLVPDASGRNAYWISMYPQIKDFVFAHAKIFTVGFGFLLIWLDHRSVLAKHRKSQPESSGLVLTLESILFLYDKDLDSTVFMLSGYLLNRGEPTIAKSWGAEYIVNGVSEAMQGFYLLSEYTMTMDDDSITIRNEHLLQAQVLTKRLGTGDGKAGRLMFTIKGDRLAQVNGLQFKIKVECSDYADRITSAVFSPDPKPLVGIKMYPGEHLRKVAKTAAAMPQLPEGKKPV